MAAAQKLMLAIDLGTGGPKTAVVSSDGTILSTGQAKVETVMLPDGGAEQDPELVWAAVVDACRQALGGLESTRDIIGVAICSQYASVVPVDGYSVQEDAKPARVRGEGAEAKGGRPGDGLAHDDAVVTVLREPKETRTVHHEVKADERAAGPERVQDGLLGEFVGEDVGSDVADHACIGV